MYLKTEPFGHNQVVLSELSWLQRIEYLEAIVEHMSAVENIPDAIPEAKKMAFWQPDHQAARLVGIPLAVATGSGTRLG
ncbi:MULTISPECIES: phage minor tail protein domain-containing protein [Symbiopectobacterium]|uniref:phage minor tail protein domain-containing protein n=1 Tax=Symbiopectobacterium TaxID=801 RepID=UPI001A1B92FC|nr:MULTISPECIES: phage minor tail protein G [Symbiopectobacterium]MBG6248816.1 hypothetical protein [Candidatus Symbiopectobacterium sp. PLON1]MBT9430399.1 hypothetical protein [Candidatus Symbiopectobacterium endolongispinus]